MSLFSEICQFGTAHTLLCETRRDSERLGLKLGFATLLMGDGGKDFRFLTEELYAGFNVTQQKIFFLLLH